MRTGSRNKTLAAAAVVSLLLHGAAIGQTDAKNAVPINIYWSKVTGKAPLSNVTFQDENQGAIPFRRAADHFTGIREVKGSWAFHDLALSYGSDEAPLALRTRAGISGIRIDIALPTFASCRREKLTELKSVPRNAPVPTRINAMLAARHLLSLRANGCPFWAQKDLAEIYFVISCSLAMQTSYFRVSEEAKESYRKLARNRASAEGEIANCDTQTLGAAIKTLHEASRKTLTKGDFAAFQALNAELRDKAGEVDWAQGFAVQKLDENVLRADLLKAFYEQQQAALSRREYDAALQFNGQLKMFLAQGEFAEAFKKISLDANRLEQDREFIENSKPTDTPEE